MNQELLPAAVLGGPEKLSKQARQEIQELSGARPQRFVAELLFNWLVVAGSMSVGVYYDNFWVTLICIFIISTRQMVLGLLLHEQVHRLGLRGKYGDWIVNVTTVYPLFITTVEDYAKVHLMHHKYFFTHKDPDFLRKSGDEWTFPTSWKKIIKIIARDITGFNTLRLIRGKTAPANADEFERRNPSPKGLRWLFFISLAGVLTLVNGWGIFLIYWVLPILTVTQLLIRWLAICEHKYNLENASILDSTPLIELKWWQKLLIPDLNFAMHAYHHAHPGVSFSNLPKVHAIYEREGLINRTAIFKGQGAYLKYLFSKPYKQ